MNLFGKTYKVIYIDDASKSTSSDNVSMAYLVSNKTGERLVMFFTDFVGIDRSLYSIEAIAFAPMRSFYFSNTLIRNYTNNPDNYPDFVKVNLNGVVENTNNRFGSVSSIATKIIVDDYTTNNNRRALCTIGARDRNYLYQGRLGEGSNACDLLMASYCEENPDDDKCSCIAHQAYLKSTAGIEYTDSALLKPYCHVGACALKGYLSRDIKAEKNSGVCAPINLCIQKANIKDSEILNSNVSLVCNQNNEQTKLEVPSKEDPSKITPPDEKKPEDNIFTPPKFEENEPPTTQPPVTQPPVTKPPEEQKPKGEEENPFAPPKFENEKPKEEESNTYVYIAIFIFFLIIVIIAAVIIKRKRARSVVNYEYFTLDNTLNDGFVGTSFEI